MSSASSSSGIAEFELYHRLLLLAVECIPLTVTVLIFRRISKLFALYSEGTLFSPENTRLIRSIGLLMLIGQGLLLIYQPLNTAVMSMNNPVGERYIALSISNHNISTIVTALVIIVASWIVGEAQKINDDAKLTV